MQDNSSLLIAVAGFAVVCAGTLFIALLLVLRVTGRSAWTFLGLLVRRGGSDADEDEPSYVPRPRQNLRELAKSIDFDTAVARNVVEQEEFGAPAAPPGAQDFKPIDSPGLERALRKGDRNPPPRRQNDYDNDEIFGGMLDFDGDGSPDT
jgi:hypothetical protein